MRTQTIDENRRCPKCGRTENQINGGWPVAAVGHAAMCMQVLQSQIHAERQDAGVPEATKQQAMKAYYSGVSGRGVGKLMGIGNVLVDFIHVVFQ